MRSAPSKYRSKKTLYRGILYDSKREADFARELDTLRLAHEPSDRVVDVERQVDFILSKAPHQIIFRLDFRVRYADGKVRHFEVKGFETPAWKIKRKLMSETNPSIIIQIIR